MQNNKGPLWEWQWYSRKCMCGRHVGHFAAYTLAKQRVNTFSTSNDKTKKSSMQRLVTPCLVVGKPLASCGAAAPEVTHQWSRPRERARSRRWGWHWERRTSSCSACRASSGWRRVGRRCSWGGGVGEASTPCWRSEGILAMSCSTLAMFHRAWTRSAWAAVEGMRKIKNNNKRRRGSESITSIFFWIFPTKDSYWHHAHRVFSDQETPFFLIQVQSPPLVSNSAESTFNAVTIDTTSPGPETITRPIGLCSVWNVDQCQNLIYGTSDHRWLQVSIFIFTGPELSRLIRPWRRGVVISG